MGRRRQWRQQQWEESMRVSVGPFPGADGSVPTQIQMQIVNARQVQGATSKAPH